MPKLEPKQIQKELEQNLLWPVYWLYGPETYKSREILQRIKKSIFNPLNDSSPQEASGTYLNSRTLEGSEVKAEEILDEARTPSFLGSTRLFIIRDAHLIKNPDCLAELLGPAIPFSARSEGKLLSVCVFLAKDLDARKKFSKSLLEGAAVVPCEEVIEAQREAWVQYLAKRRKLELTPELILKLSALDPWSLDQIDQELEKYSLASEQTDVFLDSSRVYRGFDDFLNPFFKRDLKKTLPQISYFSDEPDEALPLLGLLAWNARQLAIFLAEKAQRASYSKPNPYLADRLRKWSDHWSLHDLSQLQEELCQMDFSIKQTSLHSLGLWNQLILRFCR